MQTVFSQFISFHHFSQLIKINRHIRIQESVSNTKLEARKNNLQANSRPACYFWYKRHEASTEGEDFTYSIMIQVDFQSCRIWALNLEYKSPSPKSYTYTLFVPHGGRNWVSFRSVYGASKTRADFQIFIFGHETCSLTNVLHVPATCTSNSCKINVFSLYRKQFRFRDTGKLAIFGHEIWPLAKVPEVTHIHCLSIPAFEIELTLTLQETGITIKEF